MSWLDGLTRNWADLSDDSADPRLRPIELSAPPGDGLRWAVSVIAGLPRWGVVSSDAEARTLHATHATRLWGFVDDVHLRFEPAPGGTRVVGRSQSRVGKGDFGQNARNLRELAEYLRGGPRPPARDDQER